MIMRISKSLSATITILSIMVTLIGCGRDTEILFHVYDEEGNPVKGAEVSAGFFTGGSWSHGPTNRYYKKCITDSKGYCAYSESTPGWVDIVTTKSGYYRDSKNIQKTGLLKMEIVLKKKNKQVPMYARRIIANIPEQNVDIGFDLIESDWIKPYGNGKVADFIFNHSHLKDTYIEGLTQQPPPRTNYKLVITFPNDGDGIQSFYASSLYGSELMSPPLAPEQGYNNKLVLTLEDAFHHEKVIDGIRKKINYIFRIRTEMQNGKIVSAMHGKTHGGIRVGGQNPRIKFWYYVNPSNTRNLEFKISTNLFEKTRKDFRTNNDFNIYLY